jgi:diguanylate cyclase (GGDEF)-like protein/PAS domain S-box-containing protein
MIAATLSWFSFSRPRLDKLVAHPETSLAFKTTWRILVAGVALAVLFGVASMWFIQQNESARLLHQVNGLVSTVESTVKIACFTNDKTLAEEVARGMLTNRAVAEVRILADRNDLADICKKEADSDSSKQVRRIVYSPFDDNIPVGEIVVGVDAEYIHEESAKYSWFVSVFLLLEVVTVAIAVAFVMLRSVVKPIMDFSRNLQEIQDGVGRFLLIPARDERNEIGALARSFNSMLKIKYHLLAQERTSREEVAQNEARLRAILENTPDLIVRYDCDFRRVLENPAFLRETKLSSEDMPLKGIVHGDECQQSGLQQSEYASLVREVMKTGNPDQILVEWLDCSGCTISHEMRVVPEYGTDGTIIGALAVGRNVTERKAIERELTYRATHDALTGLPNRTLLKDRLQQSITQAQRTGHGTAVVFIDIDNFKAINDSLGHDIGDELLKLLADRMQSVMRKDDTVARQGGDEFVVLLQDCVTSIGLDKVVRKIFQSIQEPCDVAGNRIYPGASIGVAVYPADGQDMESLLRNADTAMYAAKALGRNNYQFFSPEMNQELHDWVELSGRLRQALENHEFELHYQPKVDIQKGTLTGLEALIRWRHPQNGMISPATFIPIAEKTGLINVIGQWVLQEACRQMREWLDAGIEPGRMAVNLSAMQCRAKDFLPQVRHELDTHRLPGERLEVEITESIVIHDAEAASQMLWQLQKMGVHVSVDDFGTGYSSLSYLKRLPVNTLKIDKSFVDDIEIDANDVEIIGAIIAMAHNLGLRVVAEGVETAAQLDCLRRSNCNEMQGYFFCKPLPARDMTESLRNGLFLHEIFCVE